MLCMEKLIENFALFRQTRDGRFALDIVCTILQTAMDVADEFKVYRH